MSAESELPMDAASRTLVYFVEKVIIMSRTIQLADAVYTAIEEAARADGMTAADWIAARVQGTHGVGESATAKPDWLDRDFLKTYALEADDSVSLEEVRQAMAKIPGRLADDIRAERDER